jgi:hypothetical protein
MAIIRLSIEVLQGTRDGDTPESRAAAVDGLAELQARVAEVPDIMLYSDEATAAPWGVPRRPDTFNLDFDTDLPAEASVDEACLDIVKAYVLDRPSTNP